MRFAEAHSNGAPSLALNDAVPFARPPPGPAYGSPKPHRGPAAGPAAVSVPSGAVTRRWPGDATRHRCLARAGLGTRLPPLGQLLERPGVAVGVAEGDERAPGLNVDVAGLHPMLEQVPPGGLDIRDDHLHALLRALRHLGDPRPHDHRARRPGRGELHEPQLVADLMVMVGVEPDLFGVERLGAVDVGHRYGHELDLPVHAWQRTPGTGQSSGRPGGQDTT